MKKFGEKVENKVNRKPSHQGAVPWEATGLVFGSISSKFSYFHPPNIATIPPC